MKRIFGAVVVLVLALVFVPSPAASARSVNSFRISSYEISYELSRTSENHSVLKTHEKITAEFPPYDQNHGLERAIPASYNKHSTNVQLTSVTNGEGKALPYSFNTDDKEVGILRIGEASSYVHGTQVYEITYTQQDVTRTYQDTSRDEWYWDTNGEEWKVPIDQLSIAVKIDESLVSAQQGTPFCYIGYAGSTDQCTVTGEAGVYSATAQNLQPYQNATIAFGFATGTFAQYQPTLLERLIPIWTIITAIATPIGIAVFIIMCILYVRRGNRAGETNPIVAEYIPPKDASVTVSAQVVTTSGSVFSAQLIDLAVRHYIAIIETTPKSFWRAAKYDIEVITDVSTLYDEEKEILSDMFAHVPKVGERLALSTLRNNMGYSARTLDNDRKLTALLEKNYVIREKSPGVSRFFYRWAIALLIFGVITFSPIVLLFAGFIALQGYLIRPLTDKGLALRRYVMGLRRYIKASEAERLQFLQGPDTAEKVGEVVNTDNPGQLVKLYERALPYAIIFGLEKEWSKRLGDFYQQTNSSPDWYNGTTAFNAAAFGTVLQSFSQSASYSSGSSSSSGGSSGGGSSGGGGGGGGGGGW